MLPNEKELWSKIKQIKSSSELIPTTPDLAKLTSKSIENWLKNWRELHLSKKYQVIEFNERPIWICEKKASTIADVTARGIDIARAATEIFKLSEKDNEQLVEITKVYLRQMQQLETLTEAVKETYIFHGALVDLLKKKVLHKSTPSQIYHALCFVREFLWQRDFVREYCVVEPLPGNAFSLRYVQPLSFPWEVNDLASPWNSLDTQPWFLDLNAQFAHEAWFSAFVRQCRAIWATLSVTPMIRSTPNPSNAAAMTDIFVKEDEVLVLGQHIRAAVTEALDIGQADVRQKITDWNHQQLVFPQLSEQFLHFMSIWGDLYSEGPILFTILHQTLIGDEVSFTPDQQKAKSKNLGGSVIESKYKANQHLRRIFAENNYYFDPSRRELLLIPPQNSVPPDLVKVDIKLLETNHCINMWEKRGRVRDGDINDSRFLIERAVDIYQRIAGRCPHDDFNIVLDFLTSSNHSWLTPYKSRGAEIKEALANLSQAMIQGKEPFTQLPKKTRMQIALSLQAAVELKCMLHETWAGSVRRKIANWSRDHLRKWYFLGFGHLTDWSIRISLTVLANVVKIPFIIPHAVHWYRHWFDRKTIFLAAYEGLLAESVGMLMSGCMSAIDRYGEIAEFRTSLKKQFICEDRIVSFQDTHEEKLAFREKYGSTTTKHIQAEMATGSAGTKDVETKGLIVDNLMLKTEKEDERKFYKLLAKLRSGKYDKSVKYEDYLHKREALLSRNAESHSLLTTIAGTSSSEKEQNENNEETPHTLLFMS